jgi:hypothetical protein
MTLTRIHCDDGTVRTSFVACPYCEGAIGPQESFRQHYQSCPGNPEADK